VAAIMPKRRCMMGGGFRKVQDVERGRISSPRKQYAVPLHSSDESQLHQVGQ